LGGHGGQFSSTIVHECGNIENLALRLHSTGKDAAIGEDGVELMEEMIKQYSKLPMRAPGPNKASQKAVIVGRVVLDLLVIACLPMLDCHRYNWISWNPRS
jgi:hypothetical protein